MKNLYYKLKKYKSKYINENKNIYLKKIKIYNNLIKQLQSGGNNEELDYNYYIVDYENISEIDSIIGDYKYFSQYYNDYIIQNNKMYPHIIFNLPSQNRNKMVEKKNCFFQKICREITIRKSFNIIDDEYEYNPVVNCRKFILNNDNKDLAIFMDTSSLEDKRLYSMNYVKESHLIAEDVIKWIMYQIISTFFLLHNKNIYHGNFIFTDILLSDDVTVKFANFCLHKNKHDTELFNCAKLLDAHIETHRYAHLFPPEYLYEYNHNINTYNEKIDIWSIGAFLAELAYKRNFLTSNYHREKNGLKPGGTDIIRLLNSLFTYILDPETIHKIQKNPDILNNNKNLTQIFEFYKQNQTNIKYVPIIEHNTFLNDKNVMISQKGIDIVQKCLKFLPDDRASITDLLHMPWFTEDESYNDYYKINEHGEKISKLLDINVEPISEPYINFTQKSEYIEYIKKMCDLSSIDYGSYTADYNKYCQSEQLNKSEKEEFLSKLKKLEINFNENDEKNQLCEKFKQEKDLYTTYYTDIEIEKNCFGSTDILTLADFIEIPKKKILMIPTNIEKNHCYDAEALQNWCSTSLYDCKDPLNPEKIITNTDLNNLFIWNSQKEKYFNQ